MMMIKITAASASAAIQMNLHIQFAENEIKNISNFEKNVQSLGIQI